jgi:predicted dienelactone hydrolase
VRRILVCLVGLLGLVATACSTSTKVPAAAPPIADVTTTTAVVAEPDDFAVGRRTVELVDTSRGTDADPGRDRPAEADRTLSVLLLYPADGPVTTPTEVIDEAIPAEGEFPLVVFSHGWTATGPAYEGRIREWARAGYVVAAPTFPLSSGPGGQLADYANQPGDVSFVIDQLLDLPDDDPLAGHLDPDQVGAAGHSLGAITTLGVSLNSCCADARLDAAVELSGVRLPFAGGQYDDLARVPFLAVHGGADRVLQVNGSDTLFAEAPGPAYYLRLPDAGHSDFLASAGPLVDEVVVAFLDRYLKGDDEPLAAVPEAVAASGVATFEEKPGT